MNMHLGDTRLLIGGPKAWAIHNQRGKRITRRSAESSEWI